MAQLNGVSYSTIQSRIDTLYNTQWFQPNATYPTNFFYTESNHASDGETSMADFLKKFVNVDGAKGLVTPKSNAFSDFSALLKKETEVTTGKINCKGIVLDCFVEISGLNTFTVPLDKTNGVIQNSKTDLGGKSTCTLKFLCDRNLETLQFLQAWQSKWLTFDFEKRSLVSHLNAKLDDGKKSGGEGYLGVSNVNVSADGLITVCSHLSVFGLIPKQIDGPFKSLGPQASSSSLPTISVSCTYSNAILSYRGIMSNDKQEMRFFYFQ